MGEALPVGEGDLRATGECEELSTDEWDVDAETLEQIERSSRSIFFFTSAFFSDSEMEL